MGHDGELMRDVRARRKFLCLGIAARGGGRGDTAAGAAEHPRGAALPPPPSLRCKS